MKRKEIIDELNRDLSIYMPEGFLLTESKLPNVYDVYFRGTFIEQVDCNVLDRASLNGSAAFVNQFKVARLIGGLCNEINNLKHDLTKSVKAQALYDGLVSAIKEAR